MFYEPVKVDADEEFVLYMKENYTQMLSKNPKAFIGYCLSQTKKYGIKGERLNSLLKVENLVRKYLFDLGNPDPKLLKVGDFHEKFRKPLTNLNYVKMTTIDVIDQESKQYLSVLGKEYEFTITIFHFVNLIQEHIADYGHRSHASLDGADKKAISHAVRVIDEVIELLSTGFIKFPLHNADFIKAVKVGDIDAEEALQYIDFKMNEVDTLLETTTLPECANKDFIRETILKFTGASELI